MENKNSAASTIATPKVLPGEPVVVRMNGRIDEYDISVTVLRKKSGWSDIIVTRGQDGSLNINSRKRCVEKDARHHLQNNCSLTPEQTRALIYILDVDFSQLKTKH